MTRHLSKGTKLVSKYRTQITLVCPKGMLFPLFSHTVCSSFAGIYSFNNDATEAPSFSSFGSSLLSEKPTSTGDKRQNECSKRIMTRGSSDFRRGLSSKATIMEDWELENNLLGPELNVYIQAILYLPATLAKVVIVTHKVDKDVIWSKLLC
jgi:hypothetical protein